MSRLEGRTVVAAAAVAVAALTAVVLAVHGVGEAGVRAGLRWTARASFVLFVPTFAASALVALRPSPSSKWLLRNRRYLGLGLAVSHGVHTVFIALYAARHGYPIGSQAVALVGLALLAAMAATSTDRARRRLGRRAWRALHRAGMYLLAIIFATTYAGIALERPWFAPFVIALAFAWGLRVAAWVRRRVGFRDGVRKSHTAAHQ